MNMENINTEMTQDDLIRILEYILKNNGKFTSADSIKNALFPEMDNAMFNRLFRSSLFRGIKPLTVSSTGEVIDHIAVYDGFGEYVKNLKKMVKKEKLHKIVEFLSSGSKGSYNSGEIAKAFSPELDFHEVNSLCKILINNGDVRDCKNNDVAINGMVEVLIINDTHDAYHTKKYLEEDDGISTTINQHIIAGHNINTGDNFGTFTQKDNSPKTKVSRKLTWWEIALLIIGGIASIATILGYIFGVF